MNDIIQCVHYHFFLPEKVHLACINLDQLVCVWKKFRATSETKWSPGTSDVSFRFETDVTFPEFN